MRSDYVTCLLLTAFLLVYAVPNATSAQVPHVGEKASIVYHGLIGHTPYDHAGQYADIDTTFTHVGFLGLDGVLMLTTGRTNKIYMVNWYRPGPIAMPLFHSLVDSLALRYPDGTRSDSSWVQTKKDFSRSLMINPDGVNYFEENSKYFSGHR
jgi:hypothetical protein